MGTRSAESVGNDAAAEDGDVGPVADALPSFGHDVIRRSTAAALACVLAFGLASCAGASGPTTRPALHYTDNGLEVCALLSRYTDMSVGIRVDPRGDEPITITSIRLVDGEGLRVDGAWVVPADPDDRIGLVGWPITDGGSWWPGRRPAAGATLGPGEYHDLILHVHHTGPGDGSLRDVEIEYEQEGRTRVADAHERVRMAAACD